jgi:hypothetical protein
MNGSECVKRMWKMLKIMVLKTMHTWWKCRTCVGSCVCKVSHPSFLCRNIDKVTLTCVFKRSILHSALSSFIMTTVQFTEGTLVHSLWQMKSIVWLKHTPYLSDLAVSKNKVQLEGASLQDSIDGQWKVMTLLKVIPEKEFSNFFQQWQHHRVVA